MKWKNLILALKDQGPPMRFFRNFVITRNAWGLFHKNSHTVQKTGKPKVAYNTKESAVKSAAAMEEKYEGIFRAYRCAHCGKFHVGKNNFRRQKMV
jgi:hypothetical protein